MAENLRQEREDQAREDLQYDRHYPPDRGDSRVIAEFKGTRFQRTTYLIKLIGRSGSAKISAHSKPNAERICRLVTKLHGEFESRFWLATGVYPGSVTRMSPKGKWHCHGSPGFHLFVLETEFVVCGLQHPDFSAWRSWQMQNGTASPLRSAVQAHRSLRVTSACLC